MPYNMKQIVVGIVLVGCFVGCVVFSPVIRQKAQNHLKSYLEEKLSEPKFSVKANREIPQDVDLGAFLAGSFAQSNHDYVKASQYYSQVLQKDSQYLELKADVFVLKGLLGEIEDALSLAKDINGTSVDVFLTSYALTVDLIKQKKYAEVISFLQPQKSLLADTLLKPLILGWSYAGLGNKVKAFEMIESLTDDKLSGIKTYHLALLNMYFGDVEKAKEVYRLFETVPVPSLNAWLSILSVLFPDKKIPENDALYRKYIVSLQKEPIAYDVLSKMQAPLIKTPQQAVADVLYLTALSLNDLKMNKQALVLANFAAYLDSDSVLLKLLIADLSRNIGLHSHAIHIYETFPPQIDTIQLRMAYNLFLDGQYERALDILNSFEKQGRQYIVLSEMKADIFAHLKEYEKAAFYYSKAIDLSTSFIDAKMVSKYHLLRAHMQLLQEKKEGVLADLTKAIELDAENVEALNTLGYELIDNDIDIELGLQFVRKANRLAPLEPHIQDSVAWGYYKSGDYKNALIYAERALNKLSDHAVANMHLGDIYRALGRYQEAKAQYRKALSSKMGLTPKLEIQLRENLNLD